MYASPPVEEQAVGASEGDTVVIQVCIVVKYCCGFKPAFLVCVFICFRYVIEFSITFFVVGHTYPCLPKKQILTVVEWQYHSAGRSVIKFCTVVPRPSVFERSVVVFCRIPLNLLNSRLLLINWRLWVAGYLSIFHCCFYRCTASAQAGVAEGGPPCAMRTLSRRLLGG